MWCACVSRTGSRCPLGLGLPSQETERQEGLALDWFVPDLIVFVFVLLLVFFFILGHTGLAFFTITLDPEAARWSSYYFCFFLFL